MKYLNIFAKYILEKLWQHIVLIFVWRRTSCTGLQIHLLEGAIMCLAMVFDQCKQMIGFNFGSPYKMMPSIFSTSWHSDSLVFSHVSWHLALIDILGLSCRPWLYNIGVPFCMKLLGTNVPKY